MDMHRELLSPRQKEIVSFVLFVVVATCIFTMFYLSTDKNLPWWRRTIPLVLLFGGTAALNFVRPVLARWIKSHWGRALN